MAMSDSMEIKNLSQEELIDMMNQIKEICEDASECSECIFYKIYHKHPHQVCPFNQRPFRWEFKKE